MRLFERLSLSAAALVMAAAPAAAAPSAGAAGSGAPAGCTGPASDTWITVVADGLRSGSGLFAASLYNDDSKKFLVKNGSLYTGRVDAQAGTARICMFLPGPGVYAIAMYHDENGNRKYDRNAIGIPVEGYGFTNNPATLAGLPAFRSVRLAVTKTGLVTRVHIKYP